MTAQTVDLNSIITGKLNWKNNSIDAGTQLAIILILGNSEVPVEFNGMSDNRPLYAGGITIVNAPAIGATIETDITIKVVGAGTYDAKLMIGTILTGYHIDALYDGSNIIGIDKAAADALFDDAAQQWYDGVLVVNPASIQTAKAEIISFAIA